MGVRTGDTPGDAEVGGGEVARGAADRDGQADGGAQGVDAGAVGEVAQHPAAGTTTAPAVHGAAHQEQRGVRRRRTAQRGARRRSARSSAQHDGGRGASPTATAAAPAALASGSGSWASSGHSGQRAEQAGA